MIYWTRIRSPMVIILALFTDGHNTYCDNICIISIRHWAIPDFILIMYD